MTKRILLLSAYDARSHRQWRAALTLMLPEFDWTELTLPARYFNWRIRGNSLSWAFTQQELFAQDFDLIIATSMVDLSSLRGFVPKLATIPTIVYFHENQFAYPVSSHQSHQVEAQMITLYSALCADQLVFNSAFNKQTFITGVKELLSKLPDAVPENLPGRFENAAVIPVPIANQLFKPRELMAGAHSSATPILNIVWNHRWEYDKGPQLLLELVKKIRQLALPVNLHLVGEQFRQRPPEFTEIASTLTEHRRHLNLPDSASGFIANSASYHDLLRACDVVLSTALQDFQGLALQEAIALGCTPLAPARLAYPEYLPAEFLFQGSSNHEELEQMLDRLQGWLASKTAGRNLPKPDISRYAASRLRPTYKSLIEGVTGS